MQLREALGCEPGEVLIERQYELKADTAEEASRLRKAEERRQALQKRQRSDHKLTERMQAMSKKDAKTLGRTMETSKSGRIALAPSASPSSAPAGAAPSRDPKKSF